MYAGEMDLDLAPEHVLLRDTVRDFMRDEVAPVVDEHERARRFPVDIVRRLGEMGWLGIPIPEDEGGAGLDTLAYAIAIEEIGRVWGSLGLIVAAHTSLGCGPIHLAGTPDQKARYLVPLASGRVLGGYGLTEPGAGSDAGGTRTTARHEDGPDGGSWVIDGGKRFITNAGQAGTYIVTARTGTTSGGGPEISAFIVEADRPGFSIGRLEEKMGLHASATGELVFQSVRVPAANMLGERGTGFRTFLKILDGGRISIGALAVGLAQAALDASIPYARTREQFGRPIGTFEGVAFLIADMATEIEAARGMVWRAAWLKDRGRDYSLAAAEAKLFASEVSSRATNAAIQVHGGYGYVEEYKVERYLRDAKLTEIGEGTSQIQRLVIARKILDLRVDLTRRSVGAIEAHDQPVAIVRADAGLEGHRRARLGGEGEVAGGRQDHPPPGDPVAMNDPVAVGVRHGHPALEATSHVQVVEAPERPARMGEQVDVVPAGTAPAVDGHPGRLRARAREPGDRPVQPEIGAPDVVPPGMACATRVPAGGRSRRLRDGGDGPGRTIEPGWAKRGDDDPGGIARGGVVRRDVGPQSG